MAMQSPFTCDGEYSQTPQADMFGYGAPGTVDNDEPYVICCYFSEDPEFTTKSKLDNRNKI